MISNCLAPISGFIHHTETFGAVDGPGIRFVFFLQGCNLRCLYCHNPDSIAMKGGEEWTAERAAAEVLRYKSFISGGGVTFSGGEPLMQPEFVEVVSKLLHCEGLHVAIDTAGSRDPLESAVKAAIDEADMLLLDIKAIDPIVCTELTGRDNVNAFKTLDYCEASGRPVWIRHVLLAGYTLFDDRLRQLAEKISGYNCVERIELLPFHKLGELKWETLKREYKLWDTPATRREEFEAAKRIFKECGLMVQ